MTATTAYRQVKLLVEGLLQNNGIDNLKAEVDLINAFYRMLTEGQKDHAKLVEIREDALSGYINAAAEQNKLIDMEGRVKACMGITIDGRGRYDKMLKFLIMKDVDGQTVEQYARWCKENPYSAPKFFKIAEKPDLLVTTWEMAFQKPVERQVVEMTDEIPESY